MCPLQSAIRISMTQNLLREKLSELFRFIQLVKKPKLGKGEAVKLKSNYSELVFVRVMNGRTVGTNWYGAVRRTDLWYEVLSGTVRRKDFDTNFIWYGT